MLPLSRYPKLLHLFYSREIGPFLFNDYCNSLEMLPTQRHFKLLYLFKGKGHGRSTNLEYLLALM